MSVNYKVMSVFKAENANALMDGTLLADKLSFSLKTFLILEAKEK